MHQRELRLLRLAGRSLDPARAGETGRPSCHVWTVNSVVSRRSWQRAIGVHHCRANMDEEMHDAPEMLGPPIPAGTPRKFSVFSSPLQSRLHASLLARSDSAYETNLSKSAVSLHSHSVKDSTTLAADEAPISHRMSVSVYAGWPPVHAVETLDDTEMCEEDETMDGEDSEEVEECGPGWDNLPDVVVASVMGRLPTAKQGLFRSVCQQWCHSATDSLCALKPAHLNLDGMAARFGRLQSLDLSKVTEQITVERLGTLASCLSSLTNLSLGRHHRMIVSHVTDEGLGALAGLARLQTLNLAQCVHVTDVGLSHVAASMLQLVSINISGCVQVTDMGLSQLARLRKLASIEMPWCLKVTDAGLGALGPLAESLTHLNLSGCQLVTEADATLHALRPLSGLSSLSLSGLQLSTTRVTDAGITAIACSFPGLTSLNLMWLNVTDAGCSALASLQALKHLSLRGCHSITATGVAALGALTGLEHLNLLNLQKFDVTDQSLRSLTPLRNLETLSLGDTHGGNNVTDRGLNALANFRHMRNLSLWWMHWGSGDLGLLAMPAMAGMTSLDLQGCINVRDASLYALAPLQKLASLQLARCTNITDGGLVAVAHLAGLTNLNLNNCYRVTDIGMQSVAQLPALEVLNLEGCCEISDAGVCALAPLTGLQVLNLSGCERVMGTGFAALSGLDQLSSLNLSCCSYLKDAGLAAITRFSSLTKLDLFQCVEITDTGLNALSPLTGLTGLDLAYCPKIGDAGVRALGTLTALTTLKLNSCSALSDIGLASIRPLTRLLTVHLDRCHRITDNGVEHLSGLTGLTSLRLARCHRLSDAGVVSLSRLTRLSTLSLAHCTSITDQGMRALSSLTALASLEL
eukprot:jgi/Tetstr1/453140/TSEL_040162.t1